MLSLMFQEPHYKRGLESLHLNNTGAFKTLVAFLLQISVSIYYKYST